jgi:hypothetical protein
MEASETRVEDYRPGKPLLALYWVSVISLVGLGFIVMFLVGPGDGSGLVGWPWLAALLVVGVAGPILLERLAIKRFGLHTSGMTWGGDSPYITYLWRVEETKLPKAQFAAIYGLPAAFLCAVAFTYAALSPGMFVIVGFVLAGNAGNLWFSAKALSKPEGTLVEESEEGVRFHSPPAV